VATVVVVVHVPDCEVVVHVGNVVVDVVVDVVVHVGVGVVVIAHRQHTYAARFTVPSFRLTSVLDGGPYVSLELSIFTINPLTTTAYTAQSDVFAARQ
jgi:hypothetical protein